MRSLHLVCAATLTARGIDLTSSLLCNDTQQLIQRIREKKRGKRLREKIFVHSGSSFGDVAMHIVPGGKSFTKMWRCLLDLHFVIF